MRNKYEKKINNKFLLCAIKMQISVKVFFKIRRIRIKLSLDQYDINLAFELHGLDSFKY